MAIVIDGTSYAVPVMSLEESCDFLDKYASRTQDGLLHRELIGTYHNYQLRFGAPTGQDSILQTLWEKLSEPTEYHTVTVPDADGGEFTFTAYFANVKRSLVKYKEGNTHWRGMTVNFIAKGPRRTP
jgi:hypothetical protein